MLYIYLQNINHDKARRPREALCKKGRGGLTVSALVSGSSGPGSSPGRGHCVEFLGKTLYSHSVSLQPGVLMGTGELNTWSNLAMD